MSNNLKTIYSSAYARLFQRGNVLSHPNLIWHTVKRIIYAFSSIINLIIIVKRINDILKALQKQLNYAKQRYFNVKLKRVMLFPAKLISDPVIFVPGSIK